MSVKLTKAEQTSQTRRAILDRARLLFAQKGYAATSTEEIIQELDITRGALYHQFKGKPAVFQAVVEEAYKEVNVYISEHVPPDKTAWDQLLVGCQAFLEIVQREDIRRLIFVEAPAVIPAETIAAFDRDSFGMLQMGIRAVADQGELETIDVEGFSYLLNGALNELAAWIAQSQDKARLEIAQSLVRSLLEQHRPKAKS